MKATRKTRPLAERLQAKLEVQPNGCIEFMGSRLPSGYGRIGLGPVWGAPELAHRAAWMLANGPIPNGMYICHACDNPPCCNPEHLFLGTSADNHADMSRKGRGRQPMNKTHCNHGHEFTPENTYTQPNGVRVCVTCRRARGRVHDAKRREQRNEQRRAARKAAREAADA